MNEILDRVDNIILKLKSSDEIKKIYELKANINSNEGIQKLLKEFEISKENNNNLLFSKNKLYSNKTVKEYLDIQNSFDYIILSFNSKLSSLLSNKSCNKYRK